MKNSLLSTWLGWLSSLLLTVLSTSVSSGYEVWFGLPYIPNGADDERRDEWDIVAPLIEGINTNAVDTQRPDDERNTRQDWKAIVQQMSLGKENAVLEFPRTHFAYDGFGGDRRDPLPNELVVKFRRESNYGLSIKWVMPFDNQPGEDRDLPVEEWSDADLQELRDWLDNNGRADVRIISNVRNNGTRSRSFSQKAIVEGVSIEARAQLWFENNGSRQNYLLWALDNPLVQDKFFKFQVPYNTNDGDTGFQGMREFMRWLSTPAMLGSTDFIRRNDVAFMIITYSDNFPLLAETSEDGSQYVPTLFSTALSIIEQRDLFEGRGPGGLISLEQALSYDRYEVSLAPDTGLVAHWPLDEGTGTTTADATGYGTDAALLNGASWGSDGTRSSYVSFDGTDDRIATAFNYALSDTDDFTWAWWAKKEAGSHANSIMVGNRYGGTGSESLEFIKFMANRASFANTGDAANIEDYNYTDLPSNEWHHYAMVKDGTSYQWYVDGVAEGSPVTINYNETAPLPFFIGGDGDNKPNEHFEGCIDDVVLYRSALTPADIFNVINGIYHPTVTMVDLGSPVNLTDASTWSDAQPAHANANYVIPSTGNLRSQSGTSTFPGTSLKVEAGGKFQVRSLDSNGETTTVDDLILAGGAGFGSGQFAQLAAGTGTNATNVLEGNITQSGATRLSTNGGSINRSLIINSQISGSGTLQATGAGVTITNAGNTFSGTWETSTSLVFTNSGAVGSADVEVSSGGVLDIQSNWLEDAALTVADTASTQVSIGPNEWKLARLTLGATPVTDGIYSSAELSDLGSASFSGTGRVTVGNPPIVREVIAGWDVWNSSTAPVANVTAAGITATASASTSGSNWSTTDDGSSGRGSSGDTTWGTFDGNTTPASAVTTGSGANMTALNGVTTAQITFTLTNNGASDWDLDAFHMDVLGFRPGAPRTYQLEVLSGDITNGVVFTSAEDAISDVGGTLSGNNQHDDIDLSLIGLADSRLEPGESAVIQIAFSSGAGSANGHHLFVDNVAISGVTTALTQQQAWRFERFGTIDNSGNAADSYDVNFDGESNLLEFATGQDPHANTLVSTPVEVNGEVIEFRYPRSKAALADGMIFTVEWSETLLPGSWHTTGITEIADPENPGDSEVENRLATIPAGNVGRRFIHLAISKP